MYPKCKPLHFSSRHLKSLLNLTSIHMCHHLQMMHLWIQIRFPNEVQCNDLNTSVISTRVTWALPTAIRFESYHLLMPSEDDIYKIKSPHQTSAEEWAAIVPSGCRSSAAWCPDSSSAAIQFPPNTFSASTLFLSQWSCSCPNTLISYSWVLGQSSICLIHPGFCYLHSVIADILFCESDLVLVLLLPSGKFFVSLSYITVLSTFTGNVVYYAGFLVAKGSFCLR